MVAPAPRVVSGGAAARNVVLASIIPRTLPLVRGFLCSNLPDDHAVLSVFDTNTQSVKIISDFVTARKVLFFPYLHAIFDQLHDGFIECEIA